MPKKGKNRVYTDSALAAAIENAQKDGVSVYQAAKSHGVPKSTLQNKVKGLHSGGVGAPKIMKEADETLFAAMLGLMAQMGTPLDRIRAKHIAFKVTENYPPGERRFGPDGPSDEWWERFLKDHPNVTVRTPEDVTKGVGYVTKEDLDKWFKELTDYLKSKDVEPGVNLFDFFESHPQNVLNLDESGFDLNVKPKKVFTLKTIPHAYKKEPAKHRERITATVCVAADGFVIPPQIILKENQARMIAIAETFGTHHTKFYHDFTDNGWQNTTSFFAYLKKVVSNCRKRKEVQGPLMIFVDGHPSHLDLEIYQWCLENNVVYVVLFPNATHLIQPCDLTVFRSLKAAQQRITASLNKTDLDEKDFVGIFARALNETFRCEKGAQTIRNGFRAAGLHPLNRLAVKDGRIIATSAPPPFTPPPIPINTATETNASQNEPAADIMEILPLERTREEQNTEMINSMAYFNRQWQDINKENPDALLFSSIISQQLEFMKKFSTLAPPQNSVELLASLVLPAAQKPSTQKRKRRKLPHIGVVSNKQFVKNLEREEAKEKEIEDAKEARRQERLTKAQQKASTSGKSSATAKPRGRPPTKKPKIDAKKVVSDYSSDSDV